MGDVSIFLILMFLCYIISVKLHEDLALLSFNSSPILQGKIIIVLHALWPGLCQIKLKGNLYDNSFNSSLISLIPKSTYISLVKLQRVRKFSILV